MKNREWTISKTQPYYALQIPNYHKYENECECAEYAFDITYNDEILNSLIWGDTFEITRTQKKKAGA